MAMSETTACRVVQVFGFVRLAELYYAGSHGMDIRGPTADANGHDGEVRKTRLFVFIFFRSVVE
jgi:hypothetical protein